MRLHHLLLICSLTIALAHKAVADPISQCPTNPSAVIVLQDPDDDPYSPSRPLEIDQVLALNNSCVAVGTAISDAVGEALGAYWTVSANSRSGTVNGTFMRHPLTMLMMATLLQL